MTESPPKELTLSERIGAKPPDGRVKWINAIIYGEPGCIAGDTVVSVNRAGKGYVERLDTIVQRINGGRGKSGRKFDSTIPTKIQTRHPDGFIRLSTIIKAQYSGNKLVYFIETESGKKLKATIDHKFLTPDRGWLSLEELSIDDYLFTRHKINQPSSQKLYYPEVYAQYHPLRKSRSRVPKHRLIYEAHMNGMDYEQYIMLLNLGEVRGLKFLSKSDVVHHIDGDVGNNTISNLQLILSNADHAALHGRENGYHHFGFATEADKIVTINKIGEEETFDLTIDAPNNFLANGVVVHNSGKTFFAGTAEDDPENFLPALVVDIDGGTDTLLHRKKIEVSPPIRSMENLKKLYEQIAAQPDYYKTIILDNISELQKIDMNAVMKEAKEKAQNPDNVDIYVPSQREWGKALSLDTPIPTPDGLKTIEQIEPNDRVFDESGSICNVSSVSPIYYGRKCYKVTFDDGQEIIADADHQWLTSNKRERESWYGRRKVFVPPQVRTTEEIMKTLYTSSGESNHSIRVTQPLQFEDNDSALPLDPYILGVWLGDGSSSGGEITAMDVDIISNIESSGWSTYFLDRSNNPYAFRVEKLTTRLHEMNLLHNKHVPDAYFKGSIESRQALLEGLMDTDGHASLNGQVEFSNKSIELAYAVYWLLCSLGHKSRIFSKTVNGERYFRVRFVPSSTVFRLERKKLAQLATKPQGYRRWFRYIRKIEPIESVPVKCLVVDSPSHLFLAGLGCIPTHNSGERMRIIIRAFRDLPCHTLCLAHMEEKEDKATKIMRIWPSMPGKLRHELAGFFSVVGYISTYEAEGGVFRQIQFAKTRRVQAKDRFGALPPIITANPTLPQVWKMIQDSGAQIKDETDPLEVNPVSMLQGAINS